MPKMPGGDDGEKKEETAESREEAKEQVIIIIFFSFLFIFPNTSQYMVVNKYNWNCYNINEEAWLACISSVIEIGIVNTYEYN